MVLSTHSSVHLWSDASYGAHNQLCEAGPTKDYRGEVPAAFGRPAEAGRHAGGGGGNTLRGAESGRRSCSSAKDRKSTRLNSSHSQISYAVFCLKKKKRKQESNNNLRSHRS